MHHSTTNLLARVSEVTPFKVKIINAYIPQKISINNKVPKFDMETSLYYKCEVAQLPMRFKKL